MGAGAEDPRLILALLLPAAFVAAGPLPERSSAIADPAHAPGGPARAADGGLPALRGPVTDAAGVLGDDQPLVHACDRLRLEKVLRLGIVTVPERRLAGLAPAEAAAVLLQRWDRGQGGRGAVLLVVLGEGAPRLTLRTDRYLADLLPAGELQRVLDEGQRRAAGDLRAALEAMVGELGGLVRAAEADPAREVRALAREWTAPALAWMLLALVWLLFAREVVPGLKTALFAAGVAAAVLFLGPGGPVTLAPIALAAASCALFVGRRCPKDGGWMAPHLDELIRRETRRLPAVRRATERCKRCGFTRARERELPRLG